MTFHLFFFDKILKTLFYQFQKRLRYKKVSFKIIRLTRIFTSYQFKNTQIVDRVENNNNNNNSIAIHIHVFETNESHKKSVLVF